MAAEKLTKKRLIQILCMLGILICAFVYRTVTHSQKAENVPQIEVNEKTSEKSTAL